MQVRREYTHQCKRGVRTLSACRSLDAKYITAVRGIGWKCMTWRMSSPFSTGYRSVRGRSPVLVADVLANTGTDAGSVTAPSSVLARGDHWP